MTTEPWRPERIDGDEQLLPGLEAPVQPAGEVERAARSTVAALDALDLLEPRHALLTQSLVTTARQLDRATSGNRTKDYAVANLAAQLLANYSLLPEREEADDDDPWAKLERELRETAARNAASARLED